jgi:hypothetical protein
LLQSCAAWEFRGELTFGSEFHKGKKKKRKDCCQISRKIKTGFYLKHIKKQRRRKNYLQADFGLITRWFSHHKQMTIYPADIDFSYIQII